MGNSWSGPLDPALDAGWADHPDRVGFFTDTSVCIGCKACEVACKEWNSVPADGLDFLGTSYDNTGALGASTWRHVAFIEQPAAPAAPTVDLGMPSFALPGSGDDADRNEFRWLMSSDVCKHCTHAACLDVCPTGSLFRTEFGTVVVQDNICNGCGYCIPACPYGVIERREGEPGQPGVGGAQKCTLCVDRLRGGEEPACAKACPTQSIQYGNLAELRATAENRLAALHDAGTTSANLYGNDPGDGVGGAGAFFLLLDKPEVYGLPPDPVATTRELPAMWKKAAIAAGLMLAGAIAAFGGAS